MTLFYYIYKVGPFLRRFSREITILSWFWIIFFALIFKFWKNADIRILISILCSFQCRKPFGHIFYRSAWNRPYVNPTFFWTFLDFFCGSPLFFGPNILNLDDLGPKYVERHLASLNQWNKMKINEIGGKIFTVFWKFQNFHFFKCSILSIFQPHFWP